MERTALRAPRWLALVFTLLAMVTAVAVAAWTVELPF
jgi:hypothetical protein